MQETQENVSQSHEPGRYLREASASGVWVMALGGFLVALAMGGYLFRLRSRSR